MILAIDIGNTTVAFGLLKKAKVIRRWHLSTRLSQVHLSEEVYRVLREIKKSAGLLEAYIICSVVPKATALVKPAVRQVFQKRPLIVGGNFKIPIKNLYRFPKQVGQDRLVCAYAAKILYGAPVIVVDFGTAITFDVVSAKGDYLGGAIVPGLRLYAESLFEKTALLPKVKIAKPKGVIGRDTKGSILSGIFYGYGALCDGMIRRISHNFKKRPVVIATGGYTKTIKGFLKNINHTDELLIFKGIQLAYQKKFS